MKSRYALLWVLITLGSNVGHVQAKTVDQVVPFTQPDGTTFGARVFGDEVEINWVNADGYEFVYNHEDGYFYYAELDSEGEYRATSAKVGIDDPATHDIEKHLQRSDARRAALQAERIARGFVRIPQEEGATGQYGAAGHAPCTAASPCDIYVVMVRFADQASGGSLYADYDQPWGYTMALYNQFFNGGYDGVPAYTGTTAHTSASRNSTENLEVFGSVRAWFHQVHGEDIVRFRILNECENDPCGATDEPVWIPLNATTHSNTKQYYATHVPSVYWNAAEAAACANLTLPADFPLANPCGTTPAAAAATLLANKVVYLYAGVTFTPNVPNPLALHPQVNAVTVSTTSAGSIGARYVMGEREGFGWTGHAADRFAGIGTHVHEIGHLFGLVHPTGTWYGTNPHTDPPQTRSFLGANASAWGTMQNSEHGPAIESNGYTIALASCPQPFNPFYRMDIGWHTGTTISETTLSRRIEPGPGNFYVVHSAANGQDYILDFRTASNFGQYTGFHRFTASPGLLIWRRSPSNPANPMNNESNPMVIPADGRSIFDAREDEDANPDVPEWRDRLSDPFGAAPQPHGPTVTQATDAIHLRHATDNNLMPGDSHLAFRNIRNEGTHALVDIYVNYWSGPITAATTTWSGRVTVGGDVTVASGATLTLAAGTEVVKYRKNEAPFRPSFQGAEHTQGAGEAR